MTTKEGKKMTTLKERRKALGLSQIELAKKVGVSIPTIQTWERGVGTPKPENEEKLEKILSELEEEQLKRIQTRREELM